MLGYLALFPGMVLLSQLVDVPESLVYGLSAFAFAALILALIAGRARDRAGAG